MRKFIKELKIFYNYYVHKQVYGGRFAYNSLKWCIKDKSELQNFFYMFCVECPPIPFLGEGHSGQKYYILTKKWDRVRHTLCCLQICKHKFWKTPKYIWWLMKDLYYVDSDYEYYMNPTPIRKR